MEHMKRPKFAKPLPKTLPGINEEQEQYMERMAASGNRQALEDFQQLRVGLTYRQLQQLGQSKLDRGEE